MISSRACLLALICVGITAFCASSAEEPKSVPPAQSYDEFLKKMAAPENLKEFIAVSDKLVDAVEAQQESVAAQGVLRVDTKIGLHLEFAIIQAPEAIMYYAALSRNGEPLRYQEAATLYSLFCDRAGLTHPVQITEGEKPVFYAQWLIKPKEWKDLRKKMLEVRTANRTITDPVKALQMGIGREVQARAAHQSVR